MQQHILYFVFDYKVRRWKSISIYNAAEVNLQKKVFLMIKNVFLNTS